MDIHLDQRRLTDVAEAVDFPGLDDENVARASLEFLSVDGPESAAFPHKLNFVVRMSMGAGPTPRQSAEEKHGNIDVPIIGPDELVGATLEGQLFLADAVHSGCPC